MKDTIFSNEILSAVRAAALSRKIVIYGANPAGRTLCRLLLQQEVKVAFYADDRPDGEEYDGLPLVSIYDLAFEKKGACYLVVVQPERTLKYDIFPIVHSFGMFYKEDYIDAVTKPNYATVHVRDSYLGFSREDDLPGFRVYGDMLNGNALKIVTMGGSATDPTYGGIRPWPFYLHRLLKQEGIANTVYNGGFCAYTSSNELLKFIRDVVPMEPDIVVSYSAVNDIQMLITDPEFYNRYKRPFIFESQEQLLRWVGEKSGEKVLHGLRNDKSPARHWVDNMRQMHCIAEEFGFRFMGIVQPMFNVGSYDMPEQLLRFIDEYFRADESPGLAMRRHNLFADAPAFYEEIRKLIKEHHYIRDFTHIYDGMKDIYVDFAHVTEKGNELLSREVYAHLKHMGYIGAGTEKNMDYISAGTAKNIDYTGANAVKNEVLSFYRKMPFNYYSSAQAIAAQIKDGNLLPGYFPLADEVLSPDSHIVELGCGTGWLSNMMAWYYGCRVTGVDFNRVAVDMAEQTAGLLGLDTRFLVSDLFDFEPFTSADLVISNGVLHHTGRCLEGVAKVCALVKPGGYAAVGLYHKQGRAPFLAHFEKMKRDGAGEDALLAEYLRLDSRHQDGAAAESWFKDQVLHPHETQHTAAEVWDVFEENGLELVLTSLNDFAPMRSRSDILKMEKELQQKARNELSKGRYYPGFFIMIGRKRL